MPKKTLSKPVPTPITKVQMGEKFQLTYYLNPDLWATKAEWNAISPFIDIPKTCEKIAESVVQSFNKLSVSFWDIKTGQVGTYETPIDIEKFETLRATAEKEVIANWKQNGIIVTTRTVSFWGQKSREEILDFLSNKTNLDDLMYGEESAIQKALASKGVNLWIDTYTSVKDMNPFKSIINTECKMHIVFSSPIIKQIIPNYPIQWAYPRNPDMARQPVTIYNHPKKITEYCEKCKCITTHSTIGEFQIEEINDRCTMRIRVCKCGTISVVPNISVG